MTGLGYQEWKKEYKNVAALNATKCLGFVPTDIEQQYSPFGHLRLENHNTKCTLKVMLNGGIADDELVGQGMIFFIQPLEGIEIPVTDKTFFDWVVFQNTHATENIAIGDLNATIRNY